MRLSIVLPVYNESGNLKKLFHELFEAMHFNDYEIIAVNDGSTDGSLDILKSEAVKNNKIKVIDFARNFGQTSAIIAGIDHASGEIIVLIDSDLENDPKDIIRLIGKLNEGYDVVSGWRKNRWQGSWLKRKLPSIAANWLISKISKVKLHDYGCTLKAYKRDVIKNVPLYGEMHRFIPVYSSWQGGKVTEMEVNYRKREYGKSNYGMYRIFRVILDLLLIKFLEKYMNRPIHFFGGLGIVSLFLGFFSGLTAIVFKIMDYKSIIETPLPIFSAMLIIVGVQLIVMGVIAEMIMRTYYESQAKKPYNIKEKINL
jgi:dolichol-phosphate mannosyltransferase